MIAPTQARPAHASAAQAVMERMLQDEGVALDHAADVGEAARRFSPEEHDLILLTWSPEDPIGDAPESAQAHDRDRAREEIRALRARLLEGRRPVHVPVLLLSAAPEPAAVAEARAVGADDVLTIGQNGAGPALCCARVRAYLALSARGPGRATPSPRPAPAAPSQPGLGLAGSQGALRHDVTQRLVHDLRNPLAGLSSNLAYIDERLRDKQRRDAPDAKVDPEILEALQDCRAAVGRLRRAATMLVDVGPLEEGALRPRRAEALVGPLLTEVISHRAHEASLRDLQLLCDVPADLSAAFDVELTQRLLHALLDHALRYASSGGPVLLHVRPRQGQGQGLGLGANQGLTLRVVATGEWIPHAERVYAGRGAISPGNIAEVGLGLHYALLVARAHGGSLEVIEGAPLAEGSGPGHGQEQGRTTVVVTL
jgi:signal transduction histidine kinase